MNLGQTVFSQLMEHLPHKEFQKCAARYSGDYNFKSFSCWNQFLAMAFAQLTYRESLRDIEACLRSLQSKLYHMGFRSKISRSTLADANELRDWRIYADFAQVLIRIARAPCMLTILWAWSWIKTCMHWIPRPSICACRCFPGQDFAGTKRRSRCIPCWTCTE